MKRKSGEEGGGVGEEEEDAGGVAGLRISADVDETVVVVVVVVVTDVEVSVGSSDEDVEGREEGVVAEDVGLTATVDEAVASAGKETVIDVRMEPFPVFVELVEIVTGPAGM